MGERLDVRSLHPAFLHIGDPSFMRLMNQLRDPATITSGEASSALGDVPHGTTIVAVGFPGGVAMAGDRRATQGNVIAQRDIQKVFDADEWSLVGIAGTAALAVALVRLFQVELEHYEKIEGVPLSLEGKANRLGEMVMSNLGLTMQGLAAVPLFAGVEPNPGAYDGGAPSRGKSGASDTPADRHGRIFSYDAIGGRYEEHLFHSIGSGSVFAKGSLKKLYRDDLSADEAVRVCIEALYDAADDDSATGAPDLARGIFPIVKLVDAEGVTELSDDDLRTVVEAVVAERQVRPDGPTAELSGPGGDAR